MTRPVETAMKHNMSQDLNADIEVMFPSKEAIKMDIMLRNKNMPVICEIAPCDKETSGGRLMSDTSHRNASYYVNISSTFKKERERNRFFSLIKECDRDIEIAAKNGKRKIQVFHENIYGGLIYGKTVSKMLANYYKRRGFKIKKRLCDHVKYMYIIW